MKLLRDIGAFAVLLLFLGIGVSRADSTVDFSTPGSVGLLGTTITASGVAVEGYYMDGSGNWVSADLFRRNEGSSENGLGVCNPVEQGVTPPGSCGSGTGHGDVNELDNAGQNELIRLTLPAGYTWVSVKLSSLDNNGSSSSANYERGQLWGSATGTPSTNLSAIGDNLLVQFAASGNDQPVIPISSYQNSPYLFFQPIDWKNGTNFNNDFLVYQATIKQQVPEPTTLLILGTGLLGLGGTLKRRFIL